MSQFLKISQSPSLPLSPIGLFLCRALIRSEGDQGRGPRKARAVCPQHLGICAQAPRATLPHGRAHGVFSGRIWTEPWAPLRERLNSQTETPGQGERKVHVRSRGALAPPSVPPHTHGADQSSSPREEKRPTDTATGGPQ